MIFCFPGRKIFADIVKQVNNMSGMWSKGLKGRKELSNKHALPGMWDTQCVFLGIKCVYLKYMFKCVCDVDSSIRSSSWQRFRCNSSQISHYLPQVLVTALPCSSSTVSIVSTAALCNSNNFIQNQYPLHTHIMNTSIDIILYNSKLYDTNRSYTVVTLANICLNSAISIL